MRHLEFKYFVYHGALKILGPEKRSPLKHRHYLKYDSYSRSQGDNMLAKGLDYRYSIADCSKNAMAYSLWKLNDGSGRHGLRIRLTLQVQQVDS